MSAHGNLNSLVVVGLSLGIAAFAGCGSDGDSGGASAGAGAGADTASAGDSSSDAGTAPTGSAGTSSNGGASSAGAANNGGAALGAAGDTTTGDAGASSSAPGPGIPTAGSTICSVPAVAPAVVGDYVSFGAPAKCLIWDAKATDFQKSSAGALCVYNYNGKVVDKCPDLEPAAYCAGDFTLAAMPSYITRVIYKSPSTPDAGAVARNWLANCELTPVYDLNDKQLSPVCSGSFTAKVDGADEQFTDNLICGFVSDGTHSLYTVTATHKVSTTDSHTVALGIINASNTSKLYVPYPGQSPVSYAEGATAAGAYGFPAGDPAPSVDISNFATDGSGFTGSFAFGKIYTQPGAKGNVKEVTDGKIELHFDL